MARKPETRHLHTKVVGTTFENEDGSDRQIAIRKCRPGDAVVLVPEPENPVDPNAVKVCKFESAKQLGQQLGHLNRDLAAEVNRKREAGYRIEALVTNVTGGTKSKPNRGLNLILFIGEPGISDRAFAHYAKSVGLGEDEADEGDELVKAAPRKAKKGCLGSLFSLIAWGAVIAILIWLVRGLME